MIEPLRRTGRRGHAVATALAVVVLTVAVVAAVDGSRADSGGSAVSAAAAPAQTDAPHAGDRPDTPLVDPPPAEIEDPAADVDGASNGADLPVFTHRSARIGDVNRRPVRLRVDALDIDAPISAAGRADDGQLDVPDNGASVVWYRAGSVPGAAGSSVLAAHVDYDGRPGVFFHLDDLAPGAAVSVDFDDGTTSTFEVRSNRSYVKQRLPVGRLFSRDGDPTLTLITCGGQFNATTRHYDSNTVVQAGLVDDAGDRGSHTLQP